MGLIVRFEPERVTPGTFLYTNNPTWLLGHDGQQKLLNLGNVEAHQWLTDHVDGMLRREGIDLYRQDFNIDPLPYWSANDAPDRQGLTEMRQVQRTRVGRTRDVHRRARAAFGPHPDLPSVIKGKVKAPLRDGCPEAANQIHGLKLHSGLRQCRP